MAVPIAGKMDLVSSRKSVPRRLEGVSGRGPTKKLLQRELEPQRRLEVEDINSR